MSLILDALRKSEAERRRGELPVLALELPPAHARALPRRAAWMLVAAALLAAAATAWFVQRGGQPPAVVEPLPVATPVVIEIDQQPPRRTLPAQPDRPVAPPASEPAPAPEPVAGSAPVLLLADLTADERRALPPLDLSMHLWSADPSRRFVIIDGRRLGEGDRAGNAVVERIDPEGVILAADGRRIRLPLP